MSIKEKIALWFARREIRKLVERLIGRPFTKGEKVMFGKILNAAANWQTTLIGVALGALQLHQGGLSWGSALQAALWAALGIAAKDASTGSEKVKA